MKRITILKLVFLTAFISIILMLLSCNVLALGISPGRATFDFEPGKEGTVEFKVINNEHKDMHLMFYIEGYLNNSIILYEKTANFSADESEKSFKYSFKLPQELTTPGVHAVKIIVVEIPEDAIEPGTYVGTTVAVATQLHIRVPYPRKYVEARVDVIGEDVNGTTKFVVSASNLGVQDIVNAHAVIDIMGKTGEKIAVLKTNTKSIESRKRKELIAEWKADVNSGNYIAKISIIYDEQIAELEKVFKIGLLKVELNDVIVEDFRLGNIAKFTILAENKWNEAIDDVYAEIIIFDMANKTIADSKSASVDFGPLSKATLFAYWDSAGINPGTYNGKIILYYANQTSEKEIIAQVMDDSLTVNIMGLGITAKAIGGETGISTNMNFLLIILITVLVLINLLWFLYFRKKKKK